MIYSYEQLLDFKRNGKILDWNSITKEQLEKLFIYDEISNQRIADLYDVDYETVRRKRRKWDITIYSSTYISRKLYDGFIGENKELFDILNTNSKDRLFKEENFDKIAKALTHYLFRNGPVENMHANHQLSQEDMKTLNKYMVNRIAGLLKLAYKGEWLKIELMLDFLKFYGTDWDKAEYDTKEIDLIFESSTKEFLKTQGI